jgi:hypothetical protein
MKYLIRSVKYFFYFAILSSAIVLALVLTGAVEGDINNIFEGGYSALWKIALFYAAAAAVYPKLGFIKREISFVTNEVPREDLIEFFRERRYVLESDKDGIMTFRYRDLPGRLSKMLEDHVTVTREMGIYSLEGLRKDVIRLATAFETRFADHNAQ